MSSFLLGVLGGGGPGGVGPCVWGCFLASCGMGSSGTACGPNKHAILLVICAFWRLYKVQLQVLFIGLFYGTSNSISRISCCSSCFQQFYIRVLYNRYASGSIIGYTFIAYLCGSLRLSAFILSLASGIVIV